MGCCHYTAFVKKKTLKKPIEKQNLPKLNKYHPHLLRIRKASIFLNLIIICTKPNVAAITQTQVYVEKYKGLTLSMVNL